MGGGAGVAALYSCVQWFQAPGALVGDLVEPTGRSPPGPPRSTGIWSPRRPPPTLLVRTLSNLRRLYPPPLTCPFRPPAGPIRLPSARRPPLLLLQLTTHGLCIAAVTGGFASGYLPAVKSFLFWVAPPTSRSLRLFAFFALRKGKSMLQHSMAPLHLSLSFLAKRWSHGKRSESAPCVFHLNFVYCSYLPSCARSAAQFFRIAKVTVILALSAGVLPMNVAMGSGSSRQSHSTVYHFA